MTDRPAHWFLLLVPCGLLLSGSLLHGQSPISAGDEIEVLDERADVRTGSTVVGTGELGDRFAVQQTFDKWVRVRINGREGWIARTAVRRVPEIEIGDLVRPKSSRTTILLGDDTRASVGPTDRLLVVRTPIDGKLTVEFAGQLGTIDLARVNRYSPSGTQLNSEHAEREKAFRKAVDEKQVEASGRDAMRMVSIKRDVLALILAERTPDAELVANVRTGIAGFAEFAGGRLRDLEELESELVLRRLVVAMRRTVGGVDDWRTASALAEYQYARLLADSDPERLAELRAADRQHGRADTLLREQDYFEAANVLSENLAERRRLLGDSHLLVAVSLNNLAFAHDRLNQHEKAEPLYRESLEIVGRTLGRVHPEYATRLCNLGLLHADDGDLQAAETFLKECLTVREKTLGKSNAAVRTTLEALVRLHEKAGNAAEAAAIRARLNANAPTRSR